MKRFEFAILLAAVTLAACTQATPEQQIVNDAAAAVGGAEKIQTVRTLIIEGEGTNGNLGQDMSADATSQTFTVTGYKRAIDVGSGRVRIEQTRTPNFTFFQGQQAQKQVLGLDGGVAYNVAANGTATRASDVVAKDRRAELLHHHPLTIIRAALDPAAKLSNPRTENSQSVVDVATADGLTFTLAIDSVTKLPTRIVSMTDNPNLGDVAIETSFAGYQDVSGLNLPTQLTTKTDKYTTVDLKVTKQTIDGDAGDLAAPAAAAAAAAPTPQAPNVTVQEVAPGIWWLAGQSHHSVLVEFADHMKLIEAPQNDARTLAVIAKAREIKPDKPLTHVVNSHHHFDHSGGIRAAVSEGLTIIAHKDSAPFFQDAAGRAHTIVPDALAKNPKAIKIETVDEELELKDATRTVNLYRIAGNPHADSLLMAYFPKERILVEADVYTPGGAIIPYAPNLADNLAKRKLRVDRIVPLHGAIAPYGDLTKALQATKATTN